MGVSKNRAEKTRFFVKEAPKSRRNLEILAFS